MSKRKKPSLKTKLAATLCHMLRDDGTGKFVRIIPHDHAKLMSADQIISLFHFDHDPIPKADDGPDEAWNLPPKLIREHRDKTAKIDVPQIYKTRRLSKAQAEFQKNALEKLAGQKRVKTSTIPSRPFEKGRGFNRKSKNTGKAISNAEHPQTTQGVSND